MTTPNGSLLKLQENCLMLLKPFYLQRESLKKICHRTRPAPVNPISLCDLIMDEDFPTLGGKRFLLYDSVLVLDRILMFGTEENNNILSYSTIWMTDGTVA